MRLSEIQAGMAGRLPASSRRRSSDGRKREAGYVRLGVWVPEARIREIEMLMERWPFADRAEAVSVAIRYLAAKTPALSRIDL